MLETKVINVRDTVPPGGYAVGKDGKANIWKTTDNYVYIGRNRWRKDTNFGNPWSHKPVNEDVRIAASHTEAVGNYWAWLEGSAFHDVEPERRAWILENILTLEGKCLGCFCRPPEACHGEALISMLKIKRDREAPGTKPSTLSKAWPFAFDSKRRKSLLWEKK